MLTELDILDHVLLNNNCMLMLVVDTEDVWKIESTGGFFNFKQKKLQQERNLEHLICLKKKIENYIGYIYNNGIKISFPDYDTSKQYIYEIHIITDFFPAPDYLELIHKMNEYIAKERNDIKITHEVKKRN